MNTELMFLTDYDQAKKIVQEIVEIPDKKIDLLIQSCLQNNGSISLRKRNRYFDFLTDKEVAEIETTIRNIFKFENE